MKSLHIICAKCGSEDGRFEFQEPDKYEGYSGVHWACLDCATLTSPEEVNDRIGCELPPKRNYWMQNKEEYPE